jgi:hypothetical protein
MSETVAGWSYCDGCIVCGRCNKFISCDNDVASILAAIPGHDCHADLGTGLYLRPPDVPEEGWYWAEPDGGYRRIACRGGLPL